MDLMSSALFWGFLCGVEFQKIADLLYTMAEAGNHAWMWFQNGLFSVSGFTENSCLFLVEGRIPFS
jgi:hypothetical protein